MWTSDKHEKYRARVREFAEGEIGPITQKIDRDQIFPEELVKKLCDFGLLGMVVDKKYGGTEIDMMTYIIAVEEVSRVRQMVADSSHKRRRPLTPKLGIRTFGADWREI